MKGIAIFTFLFIVSSIMISCRSEEPIEVYEVKKGEINSLGVDRLESGMLKEAFYHKRGYKHTLIFATTPWGNVERTMKIFRPLMNYLSDSLKYNIRFIVEDDYQSLIDDMRDFKVDIGDFAPVNYVKAEKEIDGLKYIVTCAEDSPYGLRDYYIGYIFTRKDSGFKSVFDLKGKKFGFTDLNSSSGYRFPYVELLRLGIKPESFFGKIFFLGKHPKVIEAVYKKSVDAGATFDQAYRKGEKKYGKVFKVLLKTRKIPNNAWAASPKVKDSIIKKLRKILVKLNRKSKDKNGNFVLPRSFPFGGFVVRDRSFYDPVRDVLKTFGD